MKFILNYLKLLAFVFAVSLTLGADSCRSPVRLLNQHSLLPIPQSNYLLYPLAREGKAEAIAAISKNAIDENDQYWLSLVGNLGSSGALYYSAMRSKNPEKIRQWFSRSADLGHPQSQFEFALLQKNIKEKHHWMTLSANAGYQPAIISMAQYSYEASDTTLAKMWLEKAAEFDASSAFKLANIYWKDGKKDSAESYFNKAAQRNFEPAKAALKAIDNYSVSTLSSLLDVAPLGPNCAQSIQFVANSLTLFVKAKSFYQQFQEDKRLADLPLCILPPIWLAMDSLICSSRFNGEPRLGCDLYPLSKLRTPLSFTHMVVFAEQGKANVNNGVMFLDQSDSYSVFVHELAHFAGFVDEYALPKKLADYHCGENQAPNLIISALNTSAKADLVMGTEEQPRYVPMQRANSWQRALDAHNQLQQLESKKPVLDYIAASRTCSNTQYKSYKPSQQMTFLEYHDVPNIPKVYRSLWRQALLARANYFAINDNLAISAFANQDQETGVFWSNL